MIIKLLEAHVRENKRQEASAKEQLEEVERSVKLCRNNETSTTASAETEKLLFNLHLVVHID